MVSLVHPLRSLGLTLVEVLVTCSLLLLLTGAITMLFLATRPVHDQNAALVHVNTWAREPIRRLSRILDTAVPPGRGSAIVAPDEGDTGGTLQFYSCDPTLSPPGQFSVRDPQYFRYRIRTIGRELTLEWLDNSGNPTKDAVLARDLDQVTFTNLNGKSIQVDLISKGAYRLPSHELKPLEARATTILSVPNGE